MNMIEFYTLLLLIIISISQSAGLVVHNCTAVSGADPGTDCVFPFTFNGEVITECTTIDGDNTPWCSTLTDQNGNHVGGQGKWGYCASTCTNKQDCVTDGGNLSGQKCVFPFTYRDTTYHSCAKRDIGKPWCSTRTDRTGRHMTGFWGYCPNDCMGTVTVTTTTTTTTTVTTTTTTTTTTVDCGLICIDFIIYSAIMNLTRLYSITQLSPFCL